MSLEEETKIIFNEFAQDIDDVLATYAENERNEIRRIIFSCIREVREQIQKMKKQPSSATTETTGEERTGVNEGVFRKIITPLDDVMEEELSVRALNCLGSVNYLSDQEIRKKTTRMLFMGDLVQLTFQDLMKIRQCGKKTATEIKNAVEKSGLTLGMTFDQKTLEAFEKATNGTNK